MRHQTALLAAAALAVVLVACDGGAVTGTPVGERPQAVAATGDEAVGPRLTGPVRAGLQVNLDARAPVTVPDPDLHGLIDFDDANTYNNAASVEVLDADRRPVVLYVYFQKAETDTWNVYLRVLDAEGPVDGIAAPFSMHFAPDGSLLAPGWISVDVPSVTGPAGGRSQPISGLVLDLGASTQRAAPFSVAVDGPTEH